MPQNFHKTPFRGSDDRKGGKSFEKRGPWQHGTGDRDSGRPMMHNATCSDCGKPCQVPFMPTGRRPVFCSNCFKRDEQGGAPRFGGSDFQDRKPSFDSRRPSFEDRPSFNKPTTFGSSAPSADSKNIEILKEQMKGMNIKLDAMIRMLTVLTSPEIVVKEIMAKTAVSDDAAPGAVEPEAKPKKERKKKK